MKSQGVSWCLVMSPGDSICVMVCSDVVSWCLMMSQDFSWCLMVSYDALSSLNMSHGVSLCLRM